MVHSRHSAGEAGFDVTRSVERREASAGLWTPAFSGTNWPRPETQWCLGCRRLPSEKAAAARDADSRRRDACCLLGWEEI